MGWNDPGAGATHERQKKLSGTRFFLSRSYTVFPGIGMLLLFLATLTGLPCDTPWPGAGVGTTMGASKCLPGAPGAGMKCGQIAVVCTFGGGDAAACAS